MARSVNRLNHRLVATVKTPGRHADGGGLYLHVDATAAKRWVFVYQWERKRREMGLGSTLTVSLAEARNAALAARKAVHEGVDPIVERRTRGAGQIAFGVFADQVIDGLAPQWRSEKHATQWRTTFTGYASGLANLPVAAVTTDDVLGVLRPIWETRPETATRVRGRIERILDAAKAKGLRQGENPARWRGHLALLLPRRRALSRGHHAALPFDQVAAFLVELDGHEAIAARALRFTILTAARSGESRAMLWGEVDWGQASWTVPAERMKTKKPHRVALSPAALAVLHQVRALSLPGEHVFPRPEATRAARGRAVEPISNMAMAMLLRRMGRGDITVHGFRSAFKDWAMELTDFPDELSEEALAHVVGNKVRRAYRRRDSLDKRRRLMEAWGAFCTGAPGSDLQMTSQEHRHEQSSLPRTTDLQGSGGRHPSRNQPGHALPLGHRRGPPDDEDRGVHPDRAIRNRSLPCPSANSERLAVGHT